MGYDVRTAPLSGLHDESFQPLLYQVATAMLAPSDVAAPLWQPR